MKETETMLTKVDIYGTKHHLEMLDKSKWFVNPIDLPTVATWIPASTIIIRKIKEDLVFSYQITNLSDDVSILAMKIRKIKK